MQNVCKCESHYLKVTVATSHFATRVLSAPDSSIELSGSSFAESGLGGGGVIHHRQCPVSDHFLHFCSTHFNFPLFLSCALLSIASDNWLLEAYSTATYIHS